MSETIEQYGERLERYLEGKDPLTIQRQTAVELARLINGLSAQQLSSRPATEKWSIVEILAHLAEDEVAASWRYRQMIEHDGEPLSGFDQDRWARLGSYRTWDSSEALELFRLLREANLRMLASLPPEEWERSGEHAQRGRLTVAGLARHMAAHDINHLKQIEALLPEQRQQAGKPNLVSSKRLPLQDVAELLQRTPAAVREMISALPDHAVAYHPGPKTWCIKEVVGHLTEEDKRDFVGRIEIILHESDPALKLNNQDQVARERRDCDKDIRELLDEFTTVRASSVRFVEQLSEADLERGGVHPKIGVIRIHELLHEWVYHDLNHAKQIAGNVQRLLWNRLGNMQGFYKS